MTYTTEATPAGIVRAIGIPLQQVPGFTQCELVRCDVQALAALTGVDVPEYNLKEFIRTCGGTRNVEGDWFGNIGSLENARRLFTEGWPEGAARATATIERVVDMVPQPALTKRRTRRLRDDGGELHLDNALRGQWDRAFHGFEKSLRRADNVVSITAGFATMCGTAHESLIWNAVQMIVVCEALENAGWRVELRGFDLLKHAGGLVAYDVMVKRPEEPLRPDLVAAMFGHGGVYRTLGFGLLCAGNTRVTGELGRDPSRLSRDLVIKELAQAGATTPSTLHLSRADAYQPCLGNLRHAFGELTALLDAPDSVAA